ncbi:hypothetical protein INR49_008154 [Caranx melampygus]|nr:hypothetical protein INR49_019986 [Caranx melampygus]KAG7232743.1 hypothetical protein INR49_008154 [Caranx melampygus]
METAQYSLQHCSNSNSAPPPPVHFLSDSPVEQGPSDTREMSLCCLQDAWRLGRCWTRSRPDGEASN